MPKNKTVVNWGHIEGNVLHLSSGEKLPLSKLRRAEVVRFRKQNIIGYVVVSLSIISFALSPINAVILLLVGGYCSTVRYYELRIFNKNNGLVHSTFVFTWLLLDDSMDKVTELEMAAEKINRSITQHSI